MLSRLTEPISFSLLALFSALFVAVGMPLLHPALHSHSENYDIISEHYDERRSAFAVTDHELHCPICDFQATSQLHDTGTVPIIAENNPASKIVLIDNVFLAKTHPLQIEPRAPPISNSL
jgi:hypothetical protein